MRLVQFSMKGSCVVKAGAQIGLDGDIVDLSGSYKTVMEILEAGSDAINQIKSLVQKAATKISPSEVDLKAPLTKPDKVLCIGMNYVDHCEEQNKPIPTEPLVFNKFPSCIVGPSEPIPYPEVSKELDWEVELVIVIGKSGFEIKNKEAMDHVFGYTVAHDVSARDWQLRKNGGQWLLGKAMNGFCPIGPNIVSTDELGDPHNLNLKCIVNGVAKQDSTTKQLVFKTQEIVSWCSKFCTLLPGDLILTGTPPGVGCFKNPPEFLKKGDVVECYIENIGSIKNP